MKSLSAAPVMELPVPRWHAVIRSYVALTKPRIISLLLFTTLAAMFIATGPGRPVTPLLILAVALGGYMAAGAANALNMVIDTDIDARMERTACRPTVTRDIPARSALFFAACLATGSFAILTMSGGLLCALLAQAGLAFYVLVYTLALKRRTPHNIVIGGAAGAFPPLVGWAAVTHALSPLAWLLFGIIFFWTPVHFWALSLLIQDDYARANVPMLPVVRGERYTVNQITVYAVLTLGIALAPWLLGYTGWIYGALALALSIGLLRGAALLMQRPGRQMALRLFKYSMIYLALLFLVMAVDHALVRAGAPRFI